MLLLLFGSAIIIVLLIVTVVITVIINVQAPVQGRGEGAGARQMERTALCSCYTRKRDDTVGNPHRTQISQFEFFELILLF